MTHQTHVGSKLAAALSAATYCGSRFSCNVFWSACVTKDCKQSQSSFELMWEQSSPWSTASTSSTSYISHLYMAHTAVSTAVVYCLQSKLPTRQSPNITVHCTQNEKTVTIQLCQYWYPSSNNDELVWAWKEVVTACLKYHCNICLKGQRKANETLSG